MASARCRWLSACRRVALASHSPAGRRKPFTRAVLRYTASLTTRKLHAASSRHETCDCQALLDPPAGPSRLLVPPMPSTLLLDLSDPAHQAWRGAFDTLNRSSEATCDRRNLVQCTNNAPFGLLICLAPTLTDELAAALSAWGGAPPCGVLLMTPPIAVDATLAERAAELGIHHWQWVADGADVETVAAAIASGTAIAQARQRQDAALRRSSSCAVWARTRPLACCAVRR
jgi:hypothetical protein